MNVKRGRFAPTPSGHLHIGNAWIALLSWLQIRQAGGQYVLRVEDIDKPRSKKEYAKQIVEDLRWMGLDWDEMYWQSEREALYEEALLRLEQEGRLYPCYCSRAELKALGDPAVYPGTCRHLSPAERECKAQKKTPALRFVSGQGEDDFVVKRADGIISYQLAVVVDDAAMGITDVLRGMDLLDSTPKQLRLYEALGLQAPRFSHTPLLLGRDARKLSKRNRSITLASIRQAGTRPEQLIGYLAMISGFQERDEPLKAADLIAEFDLRKLPRESVTLQEDMLQKLIGV
jgi:glutamyl-tRNA synthetase